MSRILRFRIFGQPPATALLLRQLMKRMGAALVIALVMGIVQPAAQEPAAAPTLSMVRQRVQDGEVDVAWSLVQKIPESSEVLREGISIALARKDIQHAVEWYERLNRRVPAGEPELLGRIGAVRVQQLLEDPDPRVVVEACRAEVVVSKKPPCVGEMRRLADNGSADMGTRLAAAGVLVDAGTSGSQAMFQTLVGIAVGTHPTAAADAAAQRPRDSARTLMSLAESENKDARYIATLALIQTRKDDTRPLLSHVAADRDAGAARLLAYIGLAAAGDRDALKIVNDTLPLMKGRELLEAGKALAAIKDPRGQQILQSVTESDNPLVAIDAAEYLYQADPTRAVAHIRTASSSTNPWVRAHALEATARIGIPLTPSMRRSMLDPNSWVAVRAVQAAAGEVARSSRSVR